MDDSTPLLPGSTRHRVLVTLFPTKRSKPGLLRLSPAYAGGARVKAKPLPRCAYAQP